MLKLSGPGPILSNSSGDIKKGFIKGVAKSVLPSDFYHRQFLHNSQVKSFQ